MKTQLLFTRNFNKETYVFYLNPYDFYPNGYYTWRDYNEVEEHTYISIKTPSNCLGYEGTILFNHGEPYTLHRYLQPWILKVCKDALIKKGYANLL